MAGSKVNNRALLISTVAVLFSTAAASNAQVAPPENSPAHDGITLQGPLAFGPGVVDFPDPAAGLAGLASYKASLSLSFSGTEAGQPIQWSQTYVLLSATAPSARQLTIERTGQQPGLESVLVAELAGVAYERRGDQPCTAAALAARQPLGGETVPVGFLSGVIGADDAGTETIAGVAARHYTFDERALGLANIASAAGEIWAAAEGGHVVKYVLAATAAGDYFGPGIEGTATWAYDLTDVNRPLVIELPADCPTGGLVDAPLLADAADIVSIPGLLTYTTPTPLADAVAYYQEQLPTLGWRQSSELFRDETTAVLDFTRSSEALLLVVTTGDGATTVQLAGS